ncbi:MAG: ATP-binding protein [Chitinispirillales bacterium]|nr:ATP-binding protein [Chitinispirillales bacterium]
MHYTLCDYLSDIVQNSIEANSSEIIVAFEENHNYYNFMIIDNGKGMSEEIQKKAIDPFYTEAGKHSMRKAGFGLPFLIMATQLCEGIFDLQSKIEVGTTIKYSFAKKSIDTPPVGNFAETVTTIFNLSGNCNIIIKRKLNGKEYSISRDDLVDALGELESVFSLSLAKQYLSGLEDEISS